MWRLLKFLVTGSWHEHSWKTVHRGKVVDQHGDGIGHFVIQECSCGKTRQKNLM